MSVTFQLRGDTAAGWTLADPVLALREPGLETDTLKWKVGDGSTAWTGLAYFNASGGGGIDFDQANSGGYLTVETTDDDDGAAGAPLALHDTGAASIGVAVTSDTGDVIARADAGKVLIASANNQVEASAFGISNRLDAGQVWGVFNSGTFLIAQISEDGSAVDFFIGSGGTFTVWDSSFARMLQMTDGSPDLHIQTGGVLVADL